ncbi:acyl carrier protein [Streptomyces sp. NPDC059371]|uniref:acyl carrier protein n=1 Tax=Streptomyces sp. NPDC059371 TaxID=3346812 RepID=UPI0036B171BC
MPNSTHLRVKKILGQVRNIPAEEITDEQVLTDEIGLDSLSLLEVVVRLEAEFRTVIPDSELFRARLRTVGDLTDLTARHIERERMESAG